jgi:dienelactone hydrolase
VQHIGGCWGGDCTVAQAHQQAVDSAVAVVAGALLSAREGKPRIIGVTSVDVVVTKEDGRG